jgi:hypothetical protein
MRGYKTILALSIHSVNVLNLKGDVYNIVKNDYEIVQQCIADLDRGFSKLTGKMRCYIQPRTKGRGYGSISRAFYARTKFLSEFITL